MSGSILVRRGGGLGDFLGIVPLLHLIRLRSPHVRLGIQCAARHLPLTQMMPIDATINEDSLPVWMLGSNAGLPEPIQRAWTGWSNVLVFGDPESDMVQAMSRDPSRTVRVKSAHPNPGSKGLYHHIAGILDPPPDDAEWTALKVPLLNVSCLEVQRGDPVLAIHAGAGAVAKQWGLERIRTVLRLLRMRGRFQIDWIVGPSDSEDGLVDAAEGLPYRILRDLQLDQLAVELKRAAVFLGNDSGPAHLAGLLGVRGIVLFGPTDPSVWRPFGQTLTAMDFSMSPAVVSDVILTHLES